MCMRKGKPAEGLEFYAILRDDPEFCKELGSAVLAAERPRLVFCPVYIMG